MMGNILKLNIVKPELIRNVYGQDLPEWCSTDTIIALCKNINAMPPAWYEFGRIVAYTIPLEHCNFVAIYIEENRCGRVFFEAICGPRQYERYIIDQFGRMK